MKIDEDPDGLMLDGDSSKSSGKTMPLTKVTIRDVARVAGVSPSTVSRALARPGRVSASTAKRILEVADRMGYHNDAVETVPLRHSTGMVAVIVPDLSNQFFSDAIHAVQRECHRENMAVVIAESLENATQEFEAFNKFVPYVDGVVIASSRMPDAMIRKCAQMRPVVVTNRVVRGVESVALDITPGVDQLAEYLSSMGFERVTYIDGPASSWSVGTRWRAFSQACANRHLAVRRLWPGMPTYEGGFSFARRYLEDPTGAVVAHNDMMAAGFIAAMRRRGYECPKDFVIAGFDNDVIAQITQPTLTSVRQPASLMGSRAARKLMQRIKGEPSDAAADSLYTSLVVRESTGLTS